MDEKKETIDKLVLVKTSRDEIIPWDRQKIVNALVREAKLNSSDAERIASQVEAQILTLNLKIITVSLIRELVNIKLLENNFVRERGFHQRLGVPIYDVDQMILRKSKETASVPHSPEGTNLALAQAIKREYALEVVFPEEASNAHLRGDIHIHNLGFVDRPAQIQLSLEYLKKFGMRLPQEQTMTKPAKHPEVLLAHMIKFSQALQGNFAGGITWDAVNVFFAPFIEKMPESELYQLAQSLIYEFSMQAFSRGGHPLFSELNLYWDVPTFLENVPAIGPGGKFTGKTYYEYLVDSQRFLWAIFQVYSEGDPFGKPFFFPKLNLHISDNFFKAQGNKEFLAYACEVASKMGNISFVFDRENELNIRNWGTLEIISPLAFKETTEPWRMRYLNIQNITINLPRIAYIANKDTATLIKRLGQVLEISAQAHMHKQVFLEKLMAHGEVGPLSLLTTQISNKPFLQFDRCTYQIGLAGLNEMVAIHTGRELHQSERGFQFAKMMVEHIFRMTEELAKRHNMRFLLCQSPAETAISRFARLDVQFFPELAKKFVKGIVEEEMIYYNNSTHFDISIDIPPEEKILKEGDFHPFLQAGAITNIFLAQSIPPKEKLANIVFKAFNNTKCRELIFWPEFIFCPNCNRAFRGLVSPCPECGKKGVEAIAAISDHYSKVSGWNKGKLAELQDRHRYEII